MCTAALAALFCFRNASAVPPVSRIAAECLKAMQLVDPGLARSALCCLHRLQVIRPSLESRRVEPPTALQTAGTAPERYRVEQPKRTYTLDPNPQQIARLLQEKRTSNKVERNPNQRTCHQ